MRKWLEYKVGMDFTKAYSPFYGNRYSEDLLICNSDSKHVSNQVWMWDFRSNGFVKSDLSEGPAKDDYELPFKITHIMYLPEAA